MCFRPPSFDDMMKTCPKCGAFNAPELTKCKKCGTDLPEDDGSAAAVAGAGPATPAAPNMPKAPGGPARPAAPTAPKRPGA